jgi:hypothetical protein
VSENVAIALGLIAVAGTLFGGWAGWRLGRTERVEQWRRDQQIAAYSELVAAGVDVARACTLAHVAETADDFTEAQREMTASVIRFHNATHRAKIVASEAVRLFVDELAELNMAATNEFKKAEPDDAVVDQSLQTAAVVRGALSEQARLDFGFAGGWVRRWLRMRRKQVAPAELMDTELGP